MDTSSVATALFDGALIGAAAALLFLFYGRLAGVTGIVVGVTQGHASERAWRAAFALGLLAGGIALLALRPSAFAASPASMPMLALAGVAVGFGARLGGGCTSGHGICGVSRLSRRALAGTMIFMMTGAIAATLVRVLGGP
jgi:uncharacterized protein